MPRRLISSGSTFEKSIGYSRAVVEGDWIFVSGTTGFDYSTMTIQDDAVAQCEQALKNIDAALKRANSGFADVVRVHYLLTSAADFERCWPAMGKAFGDVRPAATMLVVGLADPRMKIEIEVTALKQRRAAARKKTTAPARARTTAAPRRKAKAPRRKK
jgi:enamine deaminase RidA (YjgF/YER057c/UK114 family)